MRCRLAVVIEIGRVQVLSSEVAYNMKGCHQKIRVRFICHAARPVRRGVGSPSIRAGNCRSGNVSRRSKLRSILSVVFIASALTVPAVLSLRCKRLTHGCGGARSVHRCGATLPDLWTYSVSEVALRCGFDRGRAHGGATRLRYGAEASGSSQSGNPRSLGAPQGLYSYHSWWPSARPSCALKPLVSLRSP